VRVWFTDRMRKPLILFAAATRIISHLGVAHGVPGFRSRERHEFYSTPLLED
jgi:hypothetical protein